jgi:hypothetical protein
MLSSSQHIDLAADLLVVAMSHGTTNPFTPAASFKRASSLGDDGRVASSMGAEREHQV